MERCPDHMATPIAKPATCEVCDMEIMRTLRARVWELEEGLKEIEYASKDIRRLAHTLLTQTKEAMPHYPDEPPGPHSTPARRRDGDDVLPDHRAGLKSAAAGMVARDPRGEGEVGG